MQGQLSLKLDGAQASNFREGTSLDELFIA